MCTTHSLYSGEPSILIVNGWTSTFGLRGEDFLDESEDTYDPQTDRFVVSGIEVNDTVYLERNAEETYHFPANTFVNTPEADILHGPETINGYLDGYLFIGVITSVHSRIGVDYCWYRNDKAVVEGPNHCLVKIKEPGAYSCTVGYKEIKLTSCTVNVHHGGIQRCVNGSGIWAFSMLFLSNLCNLPLLQILSLHFIFCLLVCAKKYLVPKQSTCHLCQSQHYSKKM